MGLAQPTRWRFAATAVLVVVFLALGAMTAVAYLSTYGYGTNAAGLDLPDAHRRGWDAPWATTLAFGCLVPGVAAVAVWWRPPSRRPLGPLRDRDVAEAVEEEPPPSKFLPAETIGGAQADEKARKG